ncbi:MAG: hypothetical protein JWM68_222, partial [Verrucomicrobiales bacterium]|nr:hypothetical protein [Verrucomicrobiales bacterium]
FPELKVFWCCYSHRDAEDLSNHFNEHIKSKQIVAVRSNHLGLLFWEVYQRVTRCLPPGGLEFPTIWNIPTPPRLLSEKSDSTNKEVFSELETCLNKWLEQTRSGEGVPGFVLESDSPPDKARSQLRWGGLTPLCWRLFQDWSRQNNRCIWMDAEDIANTEELKIRILQAVSCQCGRSHESPSVNIEGCDDSNLLFLEELEELVQSSGKQWIIFLNLRGFLGYSADPFIRLTLPEEKVHQAGESFAQWMKNRSSNWPPEWSQNQEQKTQELIQQIANRFRSRIASVILCHKGSSLDFRSFGNFVFAPSHDITSSSERELSNVPSDTKILFLKRSFKHNSETQNWAAERAKDAIDWMKTKGCTIDEQRSRARLLRALTMSQGVRHQNAIVSRSVMQFDRTPDEWWQKADDWLRWLVSKRIVRQKPGGFLWMDWEVQEHLRYLLLEKGETLGHEAHKNRDSLHQGLADWYMTFFHATRDPLAVFHAVYHRCRVAQLSLESGDHVQARGALCEANNHLEAARANVLSRGHYIDTKKCLEGYQACLCKIVEDETEQWKVACQSKNEEKRDVHERNLRFLMMVKIKAHLYRIWFYRDVGKPDKVIEACKTFWTWRSQWSNPDLTSDSKEHLSDLYVGYWGEEDFISRAWTKLEEAIVCMSLRSYQEAEDRLTKIAENECKFPHSRDVLRLQLNEDPVPIINKWVEQRGPKVLGGDDFRYSERRLLVHVLRRMMEIRLRRSETLLALQDYGYAVADAQLENWLQEAQNLYLAAQMLPRYVSEEERGRLGVEHSRLHSVMAGVFALKGDLWGTYRQISEAGVALAELSESEESIARVVIDLRRIYCYIARLRGLTQFKKFCQSKTRGTKDDFLNREALSKEIVTAEAILNDIKQILDAVEHRMARSRKSLWWWMTMCRYRMVLLEYTGIIHTWDKSEIEIPKDIIDAAKYWMNSACRRGTFDAFQLAYIAHSYSNLIKVYRLQLHKRDDTKTDSEWQKRLRDLSYRIDDIQTRRPSTLEFQAEANIQTYIDCVLQDLRC